YTIGITNLFAAEGWNSYTSTYPRQWRLIITNDVTVVFLRTNDANQEVILSSNRFAPGKVITYLDAGSWTNFPANGAKAALSKQAISFKIPLQTNMSLPILTNAYIQSAYGFGIPGPSVGKGVFPIARWYVRVSNKFRYILED